MPIIWYAVIAMGAKICDRVGATALVSAHDAVVQADRRRRRATCC